MICACGPAWVGVPCIYRERAAFVVRSPRRRDETRRIDAMEPVAVRRIDRKSSIESEPRTLRVDQIQFAREFAQSVMNTRSIDEALTIFTGGLKPVASSGAANTDTAMDPKEECFGHGQSKKLQWPEPRDVLSAPF